MSRCALGPKKYRRIERMTGRRVSAALTRGGWPHHWALVWFEDAPSEPEWLQYQTGERQPEYCKAGIGDVPFIETRSHDGRYTIVSMKRLAVDG